MGGLSRVSPELWGVLFQVSVFNYTNAPPKDPKEEDTWRPWFLLAYLSETRGRLLSEEMYAQQVPVC